MQQQLQPLVSVSKDPDDESMYPWSFKTEWTVLYNWQLPEADIECLDSRL